MTEALPAPANQIASTTPARVLVFDRDEMTRRILGEILSSEGHTVEVASDWASARTALAREPFALLMLDPTGVGGLDECKVLLARFPEMGVVMLAAAEAAEEASATLGHGVYGLLAKPFKRKEALVTVAAALRLHDLEEDARGYARMLERMTLDHSARITQENERLRQIKKGQDEFLANLSHELRTPLTPIIGWAHVFLKRESFSEEEVRDFAETISHQGKRLHKVIESLLQTASINRGLTEARPSRVDVQELLEEAAKPAKDTGRQVKIVVCEGAESLAADPEYIGDVLENLVDNALKFSPDGTPIELAAYRRSDDYVVAVADRGPGISEDQREAVFNCFFQADSSVTRVHGGLGLGMFISRELVKAHGGMIWVDDRPGGGACVRFSIPAHSDQVRPGGAKPLDLPTLEAVNDVVGATASRILVVDDEEAICEMVSLILKMHGYEVRTATSLEAARTQLRASPYEAVICDVRMPGGLALALVRDIGSQFLDTEVIMLTGVDDPEFARAAIELGAFGYMVKPFKPQDLLINLAAALHHREAKMKERAGRRALEAEVEDRTEALRKTAGHYREVLALSYTDELTGLRNYRYFRTELEREVQRAARYGRPVALLVIDIDHFKSVNDRFGHRRGDAILAELAARLGPQIRPQLDTLARYGGEEFALILPETTVEGARTVGERIGRIVAEKPFEAELEDGLSVTISVGIAAYPDDAVSAEALFRAADWAMFRAKARGRACIVAAGEEDAEPAEYFEFQEEEEAKGERVESNP